MTDFPPTTALPTSGGESEKVEISVSHLAYYEALDAIVGETHGWLRMQSAMVTSGLTGEQERLLAEVGAVYGLERDGCSLDVRVPRRARVSPRVP